MVRTRAGTSTSRRGTLEDYGFVNRRVRRRKSLPVYAIESVAEPARRGSAIGLVTSNGGRRRSGSSGGHSAKASGNGGSRRTASIQVLTMPITQARKRARSRRLQKRSYRRRTTGIYGIGRYGGQPVMLRGQGAYNWRPAWEKFKAGGRLIGQTVVPKGTFAKAGTMAGAMLGSRFGTPGAVLGANAGAMAGDKLAQYVGFGSYNVRRNAILKLPEGQQVPSFGSLDQCTVIAHREFVANIVVPTNEAAFTVDSYRINPGNQKLFPWLSIVANCYDQYQFLGMVFHYKSTSGDSTTSPLGSIVLATDYLVTDPQYATKVEMANSQYAMTGKPTIDISHPIECDPAIHPTPLLNINSGLVTPTGRDPRWYDHGVFQIATEGLQSGTAGTVLGELWCTYQVALYKPTMAGGIVGSRGILTDFFNLPTTIAATSAQFFTLLTTSLSPVAGSSIGGVCSVGTYTFPTHISQGHYFIMYFVVGSSTTLTTPTAAVLTNCQLLPPGGGDFGGLPGGTTSAVQMRYDTIEVTSSGATYSISQGTLPASIIRAEFYVMQIDSDITSAPG